MGDITGCLHVQQIQLAYRHARLIANLSAAVGLNDFGIRGEWAVNPLCRQFQGPSVRTVKSFRAFKVAGVQHNSERASNVLPTVAHRWITTSNQTPEVPLATHTDTWIGNSGSVGEGSQLPCIMTAFYWGPRFLGRALKQIG